MILVSHNGLCIICFILLTAVSVIYQYLAAMRFFFFQALDLTVQLMEMGEKALIQADAKYAYGAQGR